MEQTEKSFAQFFEIIKRLRAQGGCPWDIDQTPLSMRDSLIEETFEAVDAISEQDAPHVKEELGDVLLNVCIIAYMHEQAGQFTVAQMFDELSQKLVRRHPHVFARAADLKPDEVLEQWDVIKTGIENRTEKSALDQVSAGFPPLLKAFKLQKKAAKQSFDWENSAGAAAKVKEEFAETLEAAREVTALCETQNAGAEIKPLTAGASDALNAAQLRVEEETGDLLFSVVNLARHLNVDPVTALSRANQKFSRRFRIMERAIKAQGKEMKNLTASELDEYWEAAKNNQ